MKIYLTTLALSLILLFLADTTITFRPFSITFGRGWQALGYVLIVMGLICLRYQWRGDGLKRGAEIKREVIEEIKQDEIKRSL